MADAAVIDNAVKESEGTPATIPAAVEEPQNELTKKFTEDEWKALGEFKTKIAEELKESSKTYTLWGINISPDSPPDARKSVVLVKFLRARNNDVGEALKMLTDTLKWREEFKVEEALKEDYPADVFGNLGHIFGKDKLNHPVTYNLYGANKDLKAVFGDVDRFIRWRVALMEKGIAKMDFETVDQMVQVHDYEGVGMSSRDANSKKAAAEATAIFQNYYPEFLYKKFFVNVPSFLTWIFWFFKPFVSAQTLAKMSVVGSGAQTIGKDLLPVIDASQLPKRYGGQSDGWETKA
ncbi:CRAL/TRIO domain-containing protein [Schizopora paradoxa]|uniref:Phosphatidylinositol transfer protein SFH5 n=1 Tax=Schizopora paradoxa TaxID=27342 RepID=A0A0H2RL94_9AGAM|nr:CRAL/TRIO domain-containing protein [Schizopora paradoxa]